MKHTGWIAALVLAVALPVAADTLGDGGAWGLVEDFLSGSGVFAGDTFWSDDKQARFGNTIAAPDCWFEWDTDGTDDFELKCTDVSGTGTDGIIFSVDTGTDDVVFVGNVSTTAGTVSAEQLTSTDDADVNDSLTCGDLVIDEAAGVVNFSGATSATISTTTADLSLTPVAGKAVVFRNTKYTMPATATVTANAATLDLATGDLLALDLQGATGAVTVTISNPSTGSWAVGIIQGTQLDTITWPGTVLWSGGSAPTITATNDAVDLVTCIWNGVAHLCSFVQDFQ